MTRIAVIGLVGKTIFMEVPRFHTGGETIVAKGIHEEWGGKGFNQAIAAARQDAAVHVEHVFTGNSVHVRYIRLFFCLLSVTFL